MIDEDEKLTLEYRRQFYDKPQAAVWPIYLTNGTQGAGTPLPSVPEPEFMHRGTALVYAIRVTPKHRS